MVKPVARELIAFQAKRFRKEFKEHGIKEGDSKLDDVQAFSTRLSKLEVDTFFLLNGDDLRKGGIDTPKALAQWGKAKSPARKKQFGAVGGDKAAFSKDEFDEICRAAAEVY